VPYSGRSPLVARVYVYSADGSRVVNAYQGSDAAWLDNQTVAVDETSALVSGSRIVIHSLAAASDIDMPAVAYGLYGDQVGHAAVLDQLFPNGANPPISLLGHWSDSAPREDGYWSEIGPVETKGWPSTWSPDGRFLALVVSADITTGDATVLSTGWGPGRTAVVEAAAPGLNRLELLRVPPGTLVRTPDVRWASTEFPFSPDSSMLAGVVEDGSTAILDIDSGTFRHRLPAATAIQWTTNSELVLARGDGGFELWNLTTGAVNELPSGFLSAGPRPGELAYTDPAGPHGAIVVRIGSASVSVPFVDSASFDSVSWAPNGSECYLLNPPNQLLRVSAP